MSFEAFDLAHTSYDSVRRDSWEQARLVAYYTAAPNLKGNITIKNFLPLKWDNESKADIPKSTKEKFDRLEQKITKIINNGR